jgi:prolyl-tRNA synthetase
MRISETFFRTDRRAPGEAATECQKLLHRGGFIRLIGGGRRVFLPVGLAAREKLQASVEIELRAAGAKRIAFVGPDSGLPDAADALVRSLKPSHKELPLIFCYLRSGNPAVSEEGAEDVSHAGTEEMTVVVYAADESGTTAAAGLLAGAMEKLWGWVGLSDVATIGVPVRSPTPSSVVSGRASVLLTPESPLSLSAFLDEEEKPAPVEFVDCMGDLKSHRRVLGEYSRHPEKTLKNLLFRVDDAVSVCVVLRGDYRLDFGKLRKILGHSFLRPLSEREILDLGSFPGYVSSIGLGEGVRVIVDESVRFHKNYWDGGDRELRYRRNVNFDRDLGGREVVDVRAEKKYTAGGERVFVCDSCGAAAGPDEAEFVREPSGLDEPMADFRMVDQPEWVCTMDDNLEFYKKPKSRFLKNVVYKTADGRIVIGVLRGDLDASAVKLARAVGVDRLELAGDDEFQRLRIVPGWVHSWGHDEGRTDVVFVADIVLGVSRNLIGGWKEPTRDAFNVNYGRDFKHLREADIAAAFDGAACSRCPSGRLRERGGMILALLRGTTAAEAEGGRLSAADKDGKDKPLWKAALDLDLGAVLAGIVETHRDERGIVWPKAVSPFAVSLLTIGKSETVTGESARVYALLRDAGWETLWDDRMDATPGVKLVDADLIGCPLRIVVSERGLKAGTVEFKLRTEKEVRQVPLDDASILQAVASFFS